MLAGLVCQRQREAAGELLQGRRGTHPAKARSDPGPRDARRERGRGACWLCRDRCPQWREPLDSTASSGASGPGPRLGEGTPASFPRCRGRSPRCPCTHSHGHSWSSRRAVLSRWVGSRLGSAPRVLPAGDLVLGGRPGLPLPRERHLQNRTLRFHVLTSSPGTPPPRPPSHFPCSQPRPRPPAPGGGVLRSGCRGPGGSALAGSCAPNPGRPASRPPGSLSR